jgi:hypothetical protein
MKEKGVFTREAFVIAEAKAKSAGPTVTSKAEQQQQETGEIDPLVDPKHEAIRRSITRKEEEGKYWVITNGTAIPIEFRVDVTGSFGDNVDKVFDALPKTYPLFAQVPGAVLERYDPQICNSFFNDVKDNGPVLLRSHFEMDMKIAEQLTLMVPLRKGGDLPEDPQYGMFGGAYLTAAEIHKLGLKGYDFTTTDAPAHGDINLHTLKEVFGLEVLEKVRENGHKIDENKLPQMEEVIQKLLENSHAFLIFIQTGGDYTDYWAKFYGSERVVKIPNANYLPHVQAAIIGLTEGTLNLQNLEKFLIEQGGLKEGEANMILRAVAHIPIGAQTILPNFDKIPVVGDKFKNKTDLWPIPEDELEIEDEPEGDNMWS